MKIRQVMLHNGFWQRQERGYGKQIVMECLWMATNKGTVRFREAWEDFRLK